MNTGMIQMGLFDERNLFEFIHPDYPDERLVACRNAELAYRRNNKRKALLDSTCRDLEKVQGMVNRGRLKDMDKIGVRLGRVINKYKMAKHFLLDIGEGRFSFRIDEKKSRKRPLWTAFMSSVLLFQKRFHRKMRFAIIKISIMSSRLFAPSKPWTC